MNFISCRAITRVKDKTHVISQKYASLITPSCAGATSSSLAQEQSQSYIHHIGKDPLVYRNVGQHLRLAAEKYPNNEAIVSCHQAQRLTYSDVLEKVVK
ncbi:hypothetical protein pipiens_012367 [Culex pipiens pipiens]|uniref:Uncharacterized protein n=1 Tax=Culex pipiens pipiens TaxID=38569 RepID=A0ABD1D2P6_CULPP